LASGPDQQIARLANAQRWRAELVTSSRAEVADWESQLQQIDTRLQSGPSFVLGEALERLGEPAQAALYYLRTPILHPSDRDLAAESLLAAGEQLEKANDHPGARSVYGELLQRYREHALAAVAEQRLEQLPPK
jgi:tetratricopeptide (TPR) repeat protein